MPRNSKDVQAGAGFFAFLLAALLITAPGRAEAQTSTEAETPTLESTLTTIRARLDETAQQTRDHQTIVAKAERRLAELEDLHETRAAELTDTQTRLTRIVMALQSLARQPPEALLSAPGEPLNGARAMMLTQYLAAEVKVRMVSVKRDLADLEALHRRINDERNRLAKAHKTLRQHHDKLNRLIASSTATRNPDTSANKPVALTEMMAALNRLFDALRHSQNEQRKQAEALRRTLGGTVSPQPATPPPPPVSRPTSEGEASASLPPAPKTAPETPPPPPAMTADDLKGRLTFPVSGKITTRFAARTAPGVTAKGIAISARPDAPVVATYDGVILYAGPFRGYESIIIIEHGDKIHTLLSGLGRIDVRIGQGVLMGEPVGAMGTGAGSGQALQRLYVELRYDGAPVDPLSWLNGQGNSVKQ